MSSARAGILARVRAAQRTGRVPRHAAHGGGLRVVRREDTFGLARFLKELDALGVDRFVEPTAEDVRARVAEIAHGRAILSWDADRLPYDAGRAISANAATGASERSVQAAAEIGVTGCHAAIAETGSLVVVSGPGTPRTASLLPPIHLCIVRPQDLFATMGDFLRARAQEIAGAACCTIITGPSRTADIELTLTLGVHGPGKVIVVVGP